jgi:hypothetical protein
MQWCMWWAVAAVVVVCSCLLCCVHKPCSVVGVLTKRLG